MCIRDSFYSWPNRPSAFCRGNFKNENWLISIFFPYRLYDVAEQFNDLFGRLVCVTSRNIIGLENYKRPELMRVNDSFGIHSQIRKFRTTESALDHRIGCNILLKRRPQPDTRTPGKKDRIVGILFGFILLLKFENILFPVFSCLGGIFPADIARSKKSHQQNGRKQ